MERYLAAAQTIPEHGDDHRPVRAVGTGRHPQPAPLVRVPPVGA
jgi:hypothetical protein